MGTFQQKSGENLMILEYEPCSQLIISIKPYIYLLVLIMSQIKLDCPTPWESSWVHDHPNNLGWQVVQLLQPLLLVEEAGQVGLGVVHAVNVDGDLVIWHPLAMTPQGLNENSLGSILLLVFVLEGLERNTSLGEHLWSAQWAGVPVLNLGDGVGGTAG